MKKALIFLTLFLLTGISLVAQVAISTDNSAPNSSAMLDVKSTSRGFLLPRMTTEQMNSIITPPDGLLVYNISNSSLYWFNGSTWQRFNEFNYTETDPVFLAHPSSGISAGDISSWNTAYGWGNHATAGYLTSYTETDPVFLGHPASGITAANIISWNLAFQKRITTAAGTAPLSLSIASNQLSGSIAVATASTDGYLTSTDWNTFSNKQNALTFGNLTSSDISVTGGNGAVVGSGTTLSVNKGSLTSPDMTVSNGSGSILGTGTSLTINKGNLVETGSAVLQILNGNSAVLGTGTGIMVKQANSYQSGYLSVNDWHVFSDKVSSQWVTSGQDISYNTGKVGIGTSAPAASAVLEVASTTKGMLLPRMTRVQRNAIGTPDEGLMVYCINCGTGGALSIFTNGSWMTFTPCSIAPPAAGISVMSQGQIIWNWLPVQGASGYKWNTVANYETATEMGVLTTKTETGTACGTAYSRYVWAYSGCGESGMTTLTATVTAAPPVTPANGTHVATLTSIVWNWNIVPGAAGYKWNTTNDFASATEMGTLTTKTETGLACGTACTRYVWSYNDCGYATPAILTQSTVACWTCGMSITVIHTAGPVAPVSKTVTYGTVTNIPGETSKCWITRNFGAETQPSAVNDGTEASAGWYFQFNRKQGFKHDGTTRTPITGWVTSINESSDWTVATDPCTIEIGSAWRIPTKTELANINGSWTNWSGPFSSTLKMHAAGYLGISGSLSSRGSVGNYWSSSQGDGFNGWGLNFGNGGSSLNFDGKILGFSIRCIKE